MTAAVLLAAFQSSHVGEPVTSCLVEVCVNKVVKARAACLFLRRRDEWKTHYTNLADRLGVSDITSSPALPAWQLQTHLLKQLTQLFT